MATINAYNIDHAKRVRFYRQNKNKALVSLGFDMVTIDYDWQAYEPASYQALSDDMQPQNGEISGMVILPRNLSLPRATSNARQEEYGVWEYHQT